MAGFYQWRGADLLLDCHLQPGARSIGFAGQHGERLKIRISAPPVDGKANSELVRFLSKLFGVARNAVTIESGELSRQKRVRICNPVQWPAGIDKPANG